MADSFTTQAEQAHRRVEQLKRDCEDYHRKLTAETTRREQAERERDEFKRIGQGFQRDAQAHFEQGCLSVQRLAECYRLTGADPDGNEDWRLAEYAVAEVTRLREEHDAAESRADTAEQRARITISALERTRDLLLSDEPGPGTDSLLALNEVCDLLALLSSPSPAEAPPAARIVDAT